MPGKLLTWLDLPEGWLPWKGQAHIPHHCSCAGCQVVCLQQQHEHACCLPCAACRALPGCQHHARQVPGGIVCLRAMKE